ncbi:MAG: hypothetical protein R6U69_03615 [Marinobacter sp.]
MNQQDPLQAEIRFIHHGLNLQQRLHGIVGHQTPGLDHELKAFQSALISQGTSADTVFNQF